MTFKPVIHDDIALREVKIITPSIADEERGAIWTSYSTECYEHLVPTPFKHDKFSSSFKAVLRGIHGDNKSWKLVSCPFGEITSAIVDLRPSSETFKKYTMHHLSEKK